jgi:hypothetical protein
MRRLLSVARVAGRNDKWLVRQLRAPDVYFSWRLDAKTYAIAVHRDHGDDDFVADVNTFADFASEDQHECSS